MQEFGYCHDLHGVPTARGSFFAFCFLPICSPYGTKSISEIFFIPKIRDPMLKFFRTIRKKLYAIGEIMLVVIGEPCPVMDYLSVETITPTLNHCAVRLRPPTGWYNI